MLPSQEFNKNQTVKLISIRPNILPAVLLVCAIIFATEAHCETDGCTIGDLSQGSWYLLHGSDLSYNHCPISGPPARIVPGQIRGIQLLLSHILFQDNTSSKLVPPGAKAVGVPHPLLAIKHILCRRLICVHCVSSSVVMCSRC